MQQTRPLFIVNPAAGNGRGKRILPQVSAALRAPADVVCTTQPGEAQKLAFQGALEGFSPIVGVGGDGTLQDVANGILRAPTPPPMGIVPAGTGNDLVRSLGLPTDPTEATRAIWNGRSGEIDVALCNERYFLNVGGVGIDTKVAKATNERQGKRDFGMLSYIYRALVELSRYTNPDFKLILDGEPMETPSLLVAVANGHCLAGGMKIAPHADLTDGLLDVCVAGDLSRLEALTLLPRIFYGGHVNHPKVSFHKVRNVRIESSEALDVQLDGEIATTLPAEFQVVPRALRLAGWAGEDHRSPVTLSKNRRDVVHSD